MMKKVSVIVVSLMMKAKIHCMWRVVVLRCIKCDNN